jgi:hypothetical protein
VRATLDVCSLFVLVKAPRACVVHQFEILLLAQSCPPRLKLAQLGGIQSLVDTRANGEVAPKAAVRATAVEPSVQPFEGRSVSRGIHKREFLIRL